MAERDRLDSNLKRKAIHNILIVIFGFIILIVVAIIFGPKLLIDYSLMMEKLQSNSSNNASNTTQQNDTYINPPALDPLPAATNKAQVNVTGIGQKNQEISLYVNNQLVDKQSVDNNSKFNFSNVALQSGQNTIQTKAELNNNESGFSNTDTISYLKNPPSLTITQPQDGQTISKSSSPSVNIEGQAGVGVKVTVNGFWAIVDDTGKYSYAYTLQNGSNDIKVVATDAAGNQTTKEIHINAQ